MKIFYIFFIFLLSTATASAAEVASVRFDDLALPETQEEKLIPRLSGKATLTYSDGSTKDFPLSYKTILRSGEGSEKGAPLGLLFDRDGEPINGAVSDNPDGSSVFERNGKIILVTHFEDYPGAVYSIELKNKDGLRAAKTRPVDFSALGGTVFDCAASKTPWDTHLGGEEDYAFDAFFFDPATAAFSVNHISHCERINPVDRFCASAEAMRMYLKAASYAGINPYDYGHVFEIKIDDEGNAAPAKRLALGKYTPELAYVMPDGKTAYMSDDGTYAGLYMFVADNRGDLSAGTLYMAKWGQKDDKDGGSADISWVRLGNAKDSEIRSIIEKRPLFTDIFDIADLTTMKCPKGFKLIKAGAPGLMCLRLKDGKNGSKLSAKFKDSREALKAAAFLETRKYGAYLGATAEFRKGEGLAYDARKNVLYLSVSSIDRSMEDSPGDPANDIRLKPNRCGALYALGLRQDKNVNSDYAAFEIKAVLTGRQLRAGEKFGDENLCDPERIANPDNLGVLKNLVLIGEDSDGHFNNMVWAFDTDTGKLTRVMTLPTGAESTGSFATFDNWGGFYIISNIQHPLGEAFHNASGGPSNMEIILNASREDRRGYVGYIEGLPAFEREKNP